MWTTKVPLERVFGMMLPVQTGARVSADRWGGRCGSRPSLRSRAARSPLPSGEQRSNGATLAAEGSAPFDTSLPDPAGCVDPASPNEPADLLRTVEAAVGALAEMGLEGTSEPELRGLLGRLQRVMGQVGAIRTRVVGELERRAVAAAGPGGASGAKFDARRRLRDELRLTASEVKRVSDTGRGLVRAPRTEAAFVRGELTDGQAGVITDALGGLDHLPDDRRGQVESELVGLARQLDAVALGRHARRLVAEADLEQAERAARHRRLRRSGRVAQTADGGVAFSGVLYGVAGERLMTAVEAFRRPDDPDGERRSPEQRTADAFDQIFDVALRSGEASARHGVRPHVLVTVPWSQLAQAAGVAELAFTGPVTIGEIRPLLDDCSFSRLVLGPDSVPVEVSRHVRTVPQGLFRAVLTRDGGCTWPGCDAPPGWCDVAHGNLPFRHGGKLTLQNCALLCRRHHRRFDAGGWQMTINGVRVSYERTSNEDNTTSMQAGSIHNSPERTPGRGAPAARGPAPTGPDRSGVPRSGESRCGPPTSGPVSSSLLELRGTGPP